MKKLLFILVIVCTSLIFSSNKPTTGSKLIIKSEKKENYLNALTLFLIPDLANIVCEYLEINGKTPTEKSNNAAVLAQFMINDVNLIKYDAILLFDDWKNIIKNIKDPIEQNAANQLLDLRIKSLKSKVPELESKL